MAQPWIKVRTDLPTDIEIIQMASSLQIHEDEVVGKLIRTWVWIQAVSCDGNAQGVTAAWLDRFIGVTGWAKAMSTVGWLEVHDDGLLFPHFDRHMSQSAKARALTWAAE